MRTPSSSAVGTAVSPAPPLPMTPTSANCDAPLNITRLSTMVCHTLSPDATETAPNEAPNAPA
nr:hypothetical protein [Jiangella rhizosphaerae]